MCPLFKTDENTTQTTCNQKESLEVHKLGNPESQILLNRGIQWCLHQPSLYHHLFGSGYSAVASLISPQVPKETEVLCLFLSLSTFKGKQDPHWTKSFSESHSYQPGLSHSTDSVYKTYSWSQDVGIPTWETLIRTGERGNSPKEKVKTQ